MDKVINGHHITYDGMFVSNYLENGILSEPKLFLNSILFFCSPTFISKVSTHFSGSSPSIHAIVICLGIDGVVWVLSRR